MTKYSVVEAVRFIISTVCEDCRVDFQDIASPNRLRNTVAARMFIAGLAREYTVASYPDIAWLCGKTTHTTFIAGINRLMAEIAKEPGEQTAVNGEPMGVVYDRLRAKVAEKMGKVEVAA